MGCSLDCAMTMLALLLNRELYHDYYLWELRPKMQIVISVGRFPIESKVWSLFTLIKQYRNATLPSLNNSWVNKWPVKYARSASCLMKTDFVGRNVV